MSMPAKQCSIDGCEKKHKSRGFCKIHYERFMRNGVPELTRRESGSGSIDKDGYLLVSVDSKSFRAHRLIAEERTGVKIVPPIIVHHVDGDKLNNDPSNLVICPNESYHRMIHRRQRALESCGDANKRSCKFCKEYDDIGNMRMDSSRSMYHVKCQSIYDKNRYSYERKTQP
jgi:hypothetical protein